jgi:hypothetical protein
MKRIWLIALFAAAGAVLLSQMGMATFTSPVSPVIPPGGVPTPHAEFYSWCTSMCRVEVERHPEHGPLTGCLRYCRRTSLENCRVQHGQNCSALYGEPKSARRMSDAPAGSIRRAR